MFRRRVRTSFQRSHLPPPPSVMFKKANHLRWIFALFQWQPGNVQRRFKHPLNRNACALHFKELKKTHHTTANVFSSIKSDGRDHIYRSVVRWKIGTNVMEIVKLELLHQKVKIHEFLKYARRPCHWTIYQELCQLIIIAFCVGTKMGRSLLIQK